VAIILQSVVEWGQEFFPSLPPYQIGPGAHPASCTHVECVPWLFQGIKRPVNDADHLLLFRPEMRISGDVQLVLLCAFLALYGENFTFTQTFSPDNQPWRNTGHKIISYRIHIKYSDLRCSMYVSFPYLPLYLTSSCFKCLLLVALCIASCNVTTSVKTCYYRYQYYCWLLVLLYVMLAMAPMVIVVVVSLFLWLLFL
jgi:hypothetical protein